MKKLTSLLAGLALVFFVFAATPTWVLAQAPAGTVAQVVVADPLPGHASAFEDGVRQHMEWYADNGSWQWNAFEIAMGERTGQYVFGTFNHAYADWDTPDVDQQENDRSIDRNIAPHVADVQVGLMQLRTDLSVLQPDRPLRPLYEVLTFDLHVGKDLQFAHVLSMLKEALANAPEPVEYFVYQEAQGGSGQFVVSVPYDNFASMSGPGADNGFSALMREAHGEFAAQNFLDQFNQAVASMTSEVFVLRPDLSVNQPM